MSIENAMTLRIIRWFHNQKIKGMGLDESCGNKAWFGGARSVYQVVATAKLRESYLIHPHNYVETASNYVDRVT